MKDSIATIVMVVAAVAWLAFCLGQGYDKQADIELSRLEGQR